MHDPDGRVIAFGDRSDPALAFEDRVGIIEHRVDRVRCVAIAVQVNRRRALVDRMPIVRDWAAACRRSIGSSTFRICVFVGAPASNASLTAVSTACSSCWRRRARISTIWRAPPGVLSMRCCRVRRRAGVRQRRAVAECARFALNNRQIVPPIENGRRTLALVRAGKDSAVFADDLPFRDDDDTLGIDPHADRAIGEGRRHAIAIALQMD